MFARRGCNPAIALCSRATAPFATSRSDDDLQDGSAQLSHFLITSSSAAVPSPGPSARVYAGRLTEAAMSHSTFGANIMRGKFDASHCSAREHRRTIYAFEASSVQDPDAVSPPMFNHAAAKSTSSPLPSLKSPLLEISSCGLAVTALKSCNKL